MILGFANTPIFWFLCFLGYYQSQSWKISFIFYLKFFTLLFFVKIYNTLYFSYSLIFHDSDKLCYIFFNFHFFNVFTKFTIYNETFKYSGFSYISNKHKMRRIDIMISSNSCPTLMHHFRVIRLIFDPSILMKSSTNPTTSYWRQPQISKYFITRRNMLNNAPYKTGA